VTCCERDDDGHLTSVSFCIVKATQPPLPLLLSSLLHRPHLKSLVIGEEVVGYDEGNRDDGQQQYYCDDFSWLHLLTEALTHHVQTNGHFAWPHLESLTIPCFWCPRVIQDHQGNVVTAIPPAPYDVLFPLIRWVCVGG